MSAKSDDFRSELKSCLGQRMRLSELALDGLKAVGKRRIGKRRIGKKRLDWCGWLAGNPRPEI